MTIGIEALSRRKYRLEQRGEVKDASRSELHKSCASRAGATVNGRRNVRGCQHDSGLRWVPSQRHTELSISTSPFVYCCSRGEIFVVVTNPTVKIYYRHRDVVVLRARNSRGAKHQRHKTPHKQNKTKTKGRDNTQVQPPGTPSGDGHSKEHKLSRRACGSKA